jgi:hypothetical protein
VWNDKSAPSEGAVFGCVLEGGMGVFDVANLCVYFEVGVSVG